MCLFWGGGCELHGALWELHEFWISRAGMLVFLCVLSWVGVVYFRSIPLTIVGAGSCNKERPPSLWISVAVTTRYNLHRSPFTLFLMTLDLYVYVVMSDGGFFCVSSLSWNLFLGFFALCCSSVVGTRHHGWDLYYPSIHKKWLDDFTMTYACSMDINYYIWWDSVCKYKKMA